MSFYPNYFDLYAFDYWTLAQFDGQYLTPPPATTWSSSVTVSALSPGRAMRPGGSFIGIDGKYHPGGSFIGVDGEYHLKGSFLGIDGKYHRPRRHWYEGIT